MVIANNKNVNKMKKLIYILLVGIIFFTACKNQDWEFDDFKYNTVYIPYQTHIRTLVLGEDIYVNTLDNAHKCKIMATMGGVYENTTDRILNIAVDYTMFDSLGIDGDSVNIILPMPEAYYSLESSMQIKIPAGSTAGGIEVQLTDAFFADPLSAKKTYVVPLRILSVTNADSILSGEGLIPDANIFTPSDWAVEPKNYVLYCIKYVNPWHGSYLRRGIDEGKGNNGNSALDTTIIKHKEYVERDEVVKLNTISLNELSLSLITRDKGSSTDIPFQLMLEIDNLGKCLVTAPNEVTYSITGNGEFVKDGDMWGNEAQDVLYLNYEVNFGPSTHSFTDTLVLRDRGVAFETFTPLIIQ
jgi:hypothetical protein